MKEYNKIGKLMKVLKIKKKRTNVLELSVIVLMGGKRVRLQRAV